MENILVQDVHVNMESDGVKNAKTPADVSALDLFSHLSDDKKKKAEDELFAIIKPPKASKSADVVVTKP